MRALVMIFLLVFGGAVALGGLIVDGKPFESSEERYKAFATATWSSQNALNDRSKYEETITPRALAGKVKQTETISAVQAAEIERRIQANTRATLQVQSAEQTVTTAAMRGQASATAEAQRVQASATAEAQKAQATAFAFSISVTQTLISQEATANQMHTTATAHAVSMADRARQAEATRDVLAVKATMEREAAQATLTYIAETPQREKEARNRQEMFENLLAGALMLSIVSLAGGLLYALLKFARALEHPMATRETGSPSEERQAPEPEPGRGIVVLPQRHAGEKEEKRRRAA